MVNVIYSEKHPSLACVETVTQTATDRTMEPRSNVWGKGGVNSFRSSRTIGIMGQSREGNWVSGHVSKPDRTDHKVAGNSDRAHILKSTPNFADEDTVTQTAKKWNEDPPSTNVWGKRGVWGTGQYETQQLKRKSRVVGHIIDWIEVYPQEVVSNGKWNKQSDTKEITKGIKPRKNMVLRILIKPRRIISRPNTEETLCSTNNLWTNR